MLRVIEPKDQCYYRSRIDVFMGLLNSQDSFHLPPEELSKATFIIAEKEEGEVFGGAILYKKYISELQDEIQNTLLTCTPHKTEVWACTPFICIEHHALAFDRDSFIKIFYRELLEKFLEFGNKEEAPFLCLTLHKDEYRRTKKKGDWPYVLEIKLEESVDELFHGILPLNGGEPKGSREAGAVFDKNRLAA